MLEVLEVFMVKEEVSAEVCLQRKRFDCDHRSADASMMCILLTDPISPSLQGHVPGYTRIAASYRACKCSCRFSNCESVSPELIRTNETFETFFLGLSSFLEEDIVDITISRIEEMSPVWCSYPKRLCHFLFLWPATRSSTSTSSKHSQPNATERATEIAHGLISQLGHVVTARRKATALAKKRFAPGLDTGRKIWTRYGSSWSRSLRSSGRRKGMMI
jgi:hypothetical protein